MFDSRDFLEAITGYANSDTSGPQPSSNRPIKLGTIDPYYTAGKARVLFDGETIMSERGYSWDTSYTPLAGQRVFLYPVGQTYLIGGSIASSVPYVRYHNIPLESTYQAYNATSFHAPNFTKTETGLVKLSGLVAHTSTTTTLPAYTLVGTLPVGFRPAVDMNFPCMTGAGNVVGTIHINSSGEIRTGNNVQGIWFSLGNIVFPTDPTLVWKGTTFVNGWTATGGTYVEYMGGVGYTKDALGRMWLRGSFGDPAPPNPSVDTIVFTTDVGWRPSPQGVYTVGASTTGTGGGFAHFFWNPNGTFSWRPGSADAAQVTVDGIVAPPADASWASPTLAGTWVSYGAGNTPGYFKDADGLVHLRGLIKSGTINTTAFTLPAGFRPSRTIIRNTPSNSTSSRIDIRADGVVIPVTGSNLWVSLDNIVFTAEQ